MIKSLILLILFYVGSSLAMISQSQAGVAILCYHEVDKPNDVFSVTSSQLESHLKMLKDKNYHFVSLDEYIKYTNKEIDLPDKSVMITFDDGYKSFYTKAYPLLQKYNVPGMIAIVGSWINGEEHPSDVGKLLTWDDLKEMESSGLVTVVSHTYSLHKQLPINPQGSRNGIAGSKLYLNNRYETDEEYEDRIKCDMEEVQKQFMTNLGHKSLATVFPYGIYTKKAVDLAIESGNIATFILDGGNNQQGDNYRLYARRTIVEKDFNNKKLLESITTKPDTWNSKGIRLAQIDIDELYDEDNDQYNRNIQSAIKVLEANKINTVALQAFADPNGDGNVSEVYFSNSQIPVRADVFGDISNRLSQSGMNVFAWLPVLNYQTFLTKDNAVKSRGEKGWYNRLSPFDTNTLKKVNKLYYELATISQIKGILLQDDLYLNDYEDYSKPAQADYLSKFGSKMPKSIKTDNEKFINWKVEALDNAADGVINSFKLVNPNAVIMRDAYSDVVKTDYSSEWLSQDYDDYLSKYDYTVVMAYPYMDNEPNAQTYLKNIANQIKKKNGTDKTIVKIQSYDWNTDKFISSKLLNNQMSTLRKTGIIHMGYYPMTYKKWN